MPAPGGCAPALPRPASAQHRAAQQSATESSSPRCTWPERAANGSRLRLSFSRLLMPPVFFFFRPERAPNASRPSRPAARASPGKEVVRSMAERGAGQAHLRLPCCLRRTPQGTQLRDKTKLAWRTCSELQPQLCHAQQTTMNKLRSSSTSRPHPPARSSSAPPCPCDTCAAPAGRPGSGAAGVGQLVGGREGQGVVVGRRGAARGRRCGVHDAPLPGLLQPQAGRAQRPFHGVLSTHAGTRLMHSTAQPSTAQPSAPPRASPPAAP